MDMRGQIVPWSCCISCMQLLVSHLYYETAEVLEPLAEHALPVLRNIYLLEAANDMKKFSKRITLKKYKINDHCTSWAFRIKTGETALAACLAKSNPAAAT